MRDPDSTPQSNPVNFGATWNKSLYFDLGAIIATETRALWLAGAVEESSWSGRPHIGLDVWSPCVTTSPDHEAPAPPCERCPRRQHAQTATNAH